MMESWFSWGQEQKQNKTWWKVCHKNQNKKKHDGKFEACRSSKSNSHSVRVVALRFDKETSEPASKCKDDEAEQVTEDVDVDVMQVFPHVFW